MRNLIDRHKALTYYILAFSFSGVLVSLQHFITNARDYSLSLPQLSPAIAVLLIAFITKNKSIFTDIKNGFFFSRKLLIWVFTILLTVVASVTIASFYLSSLGNLYKPWQGTPAFYIINVLFLVLGVAFEEIGWRGFWLPELSKRYSFFLSSIIVGVFWGIWHMNFGLGIIGYIAYIMFTTLNSILMSVIYRLSKSNLVLMVLWHFLINLSFNIFLYKRVSAESFVAIDILLGTICIAAIIWKRKMLFKMHDQAADTINT